MITYKTKTNTDYLYQSLKKNALNTQDEKNPIHQEILRQTGTLNFVVEIREDKETVKDLEHISGGVVAYICYLKLGSELIGVGRSVSVIDDKNTKYFQKNVTYTKNASIIDAVVKSVKILDSLHSDIKPQSNSGIKLKLDEQFQVKEVESSEGSISQPQKKYLLKLIHSNIVENNERDVWKNKINKFTKNQASDAIKKFVS